MEFKSTSFRLRLPARARANDGVTDHASDRTQYPWLSQNDTTELRE